MTAREKKLAGIVLGVAGAMTIGLGVRYWMVQPLKELDRQTAGIRAKIEKINADRRACFAAEDRLKSVAEKTYAETVDQASARSGEMLTRLIVKSGLEESEFARLPAGPRKLRGASEIGWSVQGEGPLAAVVNLLFLLNESPYTHRVDSLVLSAGETPGQVRVGFRYLTLVLEPGPEVTRKEFGEGPPLESAQRRALDPMIARDILRPYVKRPPQPPPATSSAPPTAPAAPQPGPETMKVVSLSDWGGQPEVHVRDLVGQRTLRFRAGDAFAGGTLVMVDYRPMPMPGHDSLQSFSRVILKAGSEYFAIERGATLAEKRKLGPGELPTHMAGHR